MGIIKAICISEKKGTAKYRVDKINMIEDFGLENDAHAGKWHRQVSLLSYDSVRNFEKRGDFHLEDGAFGENLLVEGLDLSKLPVGTRLRINEGLIEISQIGKECHHGCEIRQRVGDCIMPREGIFAKVIRGCEIETGDSIEIESMPKFKFSVITVSDKGSQGLREDKSGKLIVEIFEKAGYELDKYIIIPDEFDQIKENLLELSKSSDLILTSGGTGFSKRDVTPEATRAVIEKEVPGIPEAMRAESLKITKKAMLSRAASGIVNSCLIINLPGSPKAVEENIGVFIEPLYHGLEILTNRGGECAR